MIKSSHPISFVELFSKNDISRETCFDCNLYTMIINFLCMKGYK